MLLVQKGYLWGIFFMDYTRRGNIRYYLNILKLTDGQIEKAKGQGSKEGQKPKV